MHNELNITIKIRNTLENPSLSEENRIAKEKELFKKCDNHFSDMMVLRPKSYKGLKSFDKITISYLKCDIVIRNDEKQIEINDIPCDLKKVENVKKHFLEKGKDSELSELVGMDLEPVYEFITKQLKKQMRSGIGKKLLTELSLKNAKEIRENYLKIKAHNVVEFLEGVKYF